MSQSRRAFQQLCPGKSTVPRSAATNGGNAQALKTRQPGYCRAAGLWTFTQRLSTHEALAQLPGLDSNQD